MPAIGAAISLIATTVGSAFAAGGFFTTFAGRLLLSVALSALQSALLPKPREPGIKTKVTQTGGTNPLAFPLGLTATAGTHVCPPMSHGRDGNTPNSMLTYVILLSDVPGCTLSRVSINNEWVTLGGTPYLDYGLPGTGIYADRMWVKYYDGSQTTADAMLLARYGSYPQRPWTSDMIGRGCAYAIVTFRYDRKLFPSLPRCRFELNSIPVYDPRLDTTVGGSGAHRWANRATWQPANNPAVLKYNVLRGIALTDGSVWGGGFPAEDVPLATWFAAMNECALLVSNGAGGTQAQFRGGLEVGVDEEPADVLGELMKACAGQIAEIGGLWKTRVGPPGLPVLFITDDDIVVSKSQMLRPFPNFAGSYNGVHATYPDPTMSWESREAPPIYNSDYEADDQGQRLIADLNLAAVPYPAQVRRLQYAYIEEERRFRRHEFTLPSDAAILEPLDSISWTSSANGYTAKVFEAADVTDDLQTALQQLMLKERDPADYSYPELPGQSAPSMLAVSPTDQVVPGFAVSGVSIQDATGAARRPAIRMVWAPELEDVIGILWEIRVQATGVLIGQGSTQNVAAGLLTVAASILASTVYEVRARPVVDRPSVWTAWLPVTTPGTLLTSPDIAFGAVSLQSQTVVLGPIAKPALPTGTVVATLDIGAVGNGEAWERRIHFEARLVAPASFELVLETRYRQLGAAFTAWNVIATYTVLNDLDWAVFGSVGTLGEPYDDFEYRLRVSTGFSSGSAPVLRNVYMTAVRITK